MARGEGNLSSTSSSSDEDDDEDYCEGAADGAGAWGEREDADGGEDTYDRLGRGVKRVEWASSRLAVWYEFFCPFPLNFVEKCQKFQKKTSKNHLKIVTTFRKGEIDYKYMLKIIQ